MLGHLSTCFPKSNTNSKLTHHRSANRSSCASCATPQPSEKTASEEEQKKEVSEEWHKKAQQMADEAYAHRLKELQMSGHDEQEPLGAKQDSGKEKRETRQNYVDIYIYII